MFTNFTSHFKSKNSSMGHDKRTPAITRDITMINESDGYRTNYQSVTDLYNHLSGFKYLGNKFIVGTSGSISNFNYANLCISCRNSEKLKVPFYFQLNNGSEVKFKITVIK